MQPRVLFLLNPGRQGRNYIVGLMNAAKRMGLPFAGLELQQIWDRAAAGDAMAEFRAAHAHLARFVQDRGVTHAVGYAYNGTFDIGLVSRSDGPGRGLFPSLGVRHILLWTDHPEWASGGIALRPPLLDILRDPLMTHVLKSEAAAAEAREMLRWPNICSMPMAEDYEALRPVRGVDPVHDVVAILGDARGIPETLHRFLDDDDPDPASMDDIMRPEALRHFATVHPGEAQLASAWLDAKRSDPSRSFWTLAREHSGLDRLRGNPEHWYNAVGSLRVMLEWRRYFWLAWLARRVNVGVYGSFVSELGIAQVPAAAEWVPYHQQPATYARGRIALNTNAAHDEEGLTHKPFQIAASGTGMIHHDSHGLSDCFEVGREVLTFCRGSELLHAVRTLLGDARARANLADALRSKALRDHTWEARLSSMLAVAADRPTAAISV